MHQRMFNNPNTKVICSTSLKHKTFLKILPYTMDSEWIHMNVPGCKFGAPESQTIHMYIRRTELLEPISAITSKYPSIIAKSERKKKPKHCFDLFINCTLISKEKDFEFKIRDPRNECETSYYTLERKQVEKSTLLIYNIDHDTNNIITCKMFHHVLVVLRQDFSPYKPEITGKKKSNIWKANNIAIDEHKQTQLRHMYGKLADSIIRHLYHYEGNTNELIAEIQQTFYRFFGSQFVLDINTLENTISLKRILSTHIDSSLHNIVQDYTGKTPV